MPPRSKNGSTISSQVSRSTADGGGRVAPARRHRSSHTSSASAITTAGGTTRTASRPAKAARRLSSGRGCSRTGSTRAPPDRDGASATLSDLVTGMLMGFAPSDLDALDRQALEVGARIVRIENLAVEERLLAARRGGRDVLGGNTELLGGLAPHVLAVHLGDERLGVEAGLELAPPRVLGDEPQVMALERIGRVVAPVLHDVRAVLDHAAGAVVELALGAIEDVLDRRVDPLALCHDGGEFVLVLHPVGPLLRLHDGHQQCLRGVGIFVDIGGAQAEGFFRMPVPQLAGIDGGVADALVDELQVPRLAHAEAVHGADL